MNLSDCDKILEFAIEKLQRLQFPFAKTLLSNLEKRIFVRRNSVLSSLVGIVNGDLDLDSIGNKKLNYASKDEILQLGQNLVEKFLSDRSILSSESELIEDDKEEFDTLEMELDNTLNKRLKMDVLETQSFSKAYELYISTKVIPDLFKKLAIILNSVKPSSVIPERLFSIAGNFCRIRRANMNDDLLDALLIVNTNSKLNE